MTQGFPAQPNYGPQFQQPPQQYAPPVQQAGGYTVPAPMPQVQQPSYEQAQYSAGNFFTQQDPHVQAQQPGADQWGGQPVEDTSGFWGGASAISFDHLKGYVKGTPRGGQIISKTISNQTDLATRQPKKWDDGSARKQMQVLLQTNERTDVQDNGQRQLFIKGDMPRAVREAFQAAGKQDLEIGGWLYIAWVSEDAPKTTGFHPKKVYKAIYAPPGSPDPMAGQPAFHPAAQPPAPVPQPSASVDQYAAYAAQQAGMVPVQPQMPQQFAPQQASGLGYQPVAAPGAAPNGFDPAHEAQRAAAMYGQQPPGQAFAQAAAPEVAQMPNPVMQAYQQAAPQQFAPQTPPQGQQPAQMPPGYGQFQPGAQPGAGAPPQQQPSPNPQSGDGAVQGFNPFG